MDPYQILGVSPSASDDEVKQAYRTLSKKYHPDANINSEHQAEYTEKFKQVQNAYKTIMDSRKKGFTQQNFGGQGQSQSTYQYNGNEQAAFNDAAAYINAGRFQDALNVLEQIRTRNSIWFYYSALAMNGIGNNVTALEYAQTAAQMEPGNIQYIFLVQQLQAGSGQYRSTQQSYGSPYSAINCCYSFMMLQLFMSCCCRC
ncbi:MAG: J domain-containing protein [Longibaculum muris]|uniref:Molecular chaperone DnaJ n=1 Tax=Longibaculum muris TaxID=1796628 RepID=A0A4R3Z526_9FIRM|nr:J domain-containing protein [Longibaculum muris]KXU51432.1 DnaJ domain protein [Candidatus Stoquefichus sp. KLE1796]MBS5369092.1 J domain-containing protein [Coprobacillus cateniformis]MCR1887777.1 J domain-containing protein [Longibaculum muris]MED9812183.1 J domain-containing protein [Longibaculum muris]TCW01317.1 molecular chaperone DnaJ [Longibaculum muris]